MTKTAMNNNQRTKAAVKTNKQLVNGFKKFGYQVQVGPWSCAACKDEMITAAQSVGYTGENLPPWGNATIALKFKKGGVTIAACKCGWRKDISIKFTKVEKSKCTGCGANLNAEGKCYNPKCTNTSYVEPGNQTPTIPTAPAKVCSRANCGNPVAAGRKTICDPCRNTPKEPVSSSVIM